MPMADVTWRLNPACALRWRRWGDEWVVFDAGAGDTHQLDPVGAVALMCFEAAPRSLADLTAEVAAELELPAGATLAGNLADLVRQFGNLGLIEAIAP
jgi:PqqD family protein of HPr-rel-A system